MINKKKVFSRIGIICSIIICLLTLSSCSNKKLKLIQEVDNLKVGESFQIRISYKDEEMDITDFFYASENPDVANVSESGKITASRPGKAKIVVQLKDEKKKKLEFKINVSYDVRDYEPLEKDKKSEKVEPSESYPFWAENSYVERADNWKIMDIVKIVVEKGKGEYVFTELYKHLDVRKDAFIIIADWGNSDVVLDDTLFDNIDLQGFIGDRLLVKKDLVGLLGTERALESIKEGVHKKLTAYQGKVYLSELPDDYQYRVSVKIDYTIYKTANFYSKGLVSGGLSVILDLIKLDIKTFLDSYTYSENKYEIMLNGFEVVIEKRAK